MQKKDIWDDLRRPMAAGLVMGMLVFVFPLLALLGAGETAETLPPVPTPVTEASSPPTAAPGEWDSSYTLRVLDKEGNVTVMTMSDYLWRVVAAEMPASFEKEALRAQAVCARTYALWKASAGSHEQDGADVCTDSSCCQAYIEPEDAAANWGESAEEYTAKLAAAVADTDGQVMTYEGKPIQAVFFSSSTSATEDAAAVWGNSVPYLTSVDSPEGDEVPNYRSAVTLSTEEVRTLVEETYAGADLSGDPSGWFSGASYTASGRVAEISVGGITLSGGAARTLFSLRSACFTVDYADGAFTFSVVGYGHGVGMSQYGANAMAKEGSGWREILKHYYTGIAIQTGL